MPVTQNLPDVYIALEIFGHWLIEINPERGRQNMRVMYLFGPTVFYCYYCY